MKRMDAFDRARARELGRMFSLANRKGYNMDNFVEKLMCGEIGALLDDRDGTYQRYGFAYIAGVIADSMTDNEKNGGNKYSEEFLRWCACIYRTWQTIYNESSKDIWKQAKLEDLRLVYMPYHTLSCEMAIDRIKETDFTDTDYKKE